MKTNILVSIITSAITVFVLNHFWTFILLSMIFYPIYLYKKEIWKFVKSLFETEPPKDYMQDIISILFQEIANKRVKYKPYRF